MEGFPRYQSSLSSNCLSFDSRAATFTYWSSSKWQNQLKIEVDDVVIHMKAKEVDNWTLQFEDVCKAEISVFAENKQRHRLC